MTLWSNYKPIKPKLQPIWKPIFNWTQMSKFISMAQIAILVNRPVFSFSPIQWNNKFKSFSCFGRDSNSGVWAQMQAQTLFTSNLICTPLAEPSPLWTRCPITLQAWTQPEPKPQIWFKLWNPAQKVFFVVIIITKSAFLADKVHIRTSFTHTKKDRFVLEEKAENR